MKKKLRGITQPDFKAYIINQSNQDCVVLVEGPLEENTANPENVPHKARSLMKVRKQFDEGRMVFLTSAAGTSGYP